MRFKEIVKNIVAALFLGVTLMSVLATSSPRNPDSPGDGQHGIVSDCVNPTAEATIVIVDDQVTSPGGVSFTDFGFPQATIGKSVSGTVGSVNRECFVTYGEDGLNHVEDRWLYSCFDNGRFSCSIYIEPQ